MPTQAGLATAGENLAERQVWDRLVARYLPMALTVAMGVMFVITLVMFIGVACAVTAWYLRGDATGLYIKIEFLR